MTIVVSPLHGIDEAVRRHAPTRAIGLLSPGMAPPALPFAEMERLHLSFNDIIEPRDGLIPPDAAHMATILSFMDAWDGRAPLLVHCWAGVSRSTAVGYIAACLREPPGGEAEIADALRRAAPFATPNTLLVRLADAALGRDGRMIAAIAAIGRGAETSLGEPFVL